MRIVVDASVALKWLLLDEPGSALALALREHELIAPALWLVEAANALWRSTRIGQLSAVEVPEFLSELLNAPVASLPIEPYIGRALQVATQLSHPVYDCLYLAVAIQHDTHVITADRRFAAIAARPGFAGHVRLLGA
ncbi:MAG TPA: type II toxin-antitoxin system VapC family toxin [Stellaceae bacterium]|nr:type II toxin-antitoxin system VapC family toxin [Stellaceae bacterium]